MWNRNDSNDFLIKTNLKQCLYSELTKTFQNDLIFWYWLPLETYRLCKLETFHCHSEFINISLIILNQHNSNWKNA